MRSFQLGTYDYMYKNVIESYSGYLQFQNEEYGDEPTLDNSFMADNALMALTVSDPNVAEVVQRLESFALAASGSRTQGVMVLGIEPEREERLSDLKDRLVRYKLTDNAADALKSEALPARTLRLLDLFRNESWSGTGRMMLDLGISEEDSSSIMPLIRKHAFSTNEYITDSDSSGILIGSGLAEYLKTRVGDTLVLMGQGYHGSSAAGNFIISGIIRLPSPDIDKIIVYMPLESARHLFAADGLATSAVLRLRDTGERELTATAERLRQNISSPLAVRTWQEINALLLNQMEADNRSGMIMIGILYLVIAFGVFGTVLMMLAERRREFGMLVAVGMQKKKLAGIITLEMLLIGFLGVASGVAASVPLVIYGNLHPLRFTGEFARMYEDYGMDPVMPMLMPDIYYLWQSVVVLLIISVAVVFSIRKILRINVINSLKA